MRSRKNYAGEEPETGMQLGVAQSRGEQAAVTHWYLGIFLLADDAGDVMESIEAQYKPDPVQITVFGRWLKGLGLTPVSWATLVSVLKVIELNIMAERNEDEFGK